MGYVNFNPNPTRKLVGDCVIRAISAVYREQCMNQINEFMFYIEIFNLII